MREIAFATADLSIIMNQHDQHALRGDRPTRVSNCYCYKLTCPQHTTATTTQHHLSPPVPCS